MDKTSVWRIYFSVLLICTGLAAASLWFVPADIGDPLFFGLSKARSVLAVFFIAIGVVLSIWNWFFINGKSDFIKKFEMLIENKWSYSLLFSVLLLGTLTSTHYLIFAHQAIQSPLFYYLQHLISVFIFGLLFCVFSLALISWIYYGNIREEIEQGITFRNTVSWALIAYGSVVRFFPFLFINIKHPFREAGLFTLFAQSIREASFLLPQHIPFYTDMGIPFAYPPLPFYIEALLLELGIHHILLANILPPFFASLSLVAMFYLLKTLDIPLLTHLAILFSFATMPGAFIEPIDSAGLAEGFGVLTLLLLITGYLKAYHSGSIKSYFHAGIFWALAIMGSPGGAYLSVFLFFIFIIAIWHKEKFRFHQKWLRPIVMLGIIAIVLSAPYWVTILTRYGGALFVDSVQAQHSSRGLSRSITDLFVNFNPGNLNRQFSFFWNFLIFIGLINSIQRGWFSLIAWLVISNFIPRESAWLVAVPASILAGIGLSAGLNFILNPPNQQSKSVRFRPLVWLPILGLGIFHIFLNIQYVYDLLMGGYDKATWASFEADTAWIQENTPIDAKFIIIGDFDDYYVEWFPYIAKRNTLNMIYGAEWEPEDYRKANTFQYRYPKCEDYLCIQDYIESIFGYQGIYVYLYVDEMSPAYKHLRPDEAMQKLPSNLNMVILYQDEGASVFYLQKK